MKKLVILLTILIIVFASTASAAHFITRTIYGEGLQVSRTALPYQSSVNDVLPVFVSADNAADDTLKFVRVYVTIPELGIRRSTLIGDDGRLPDTQSESDRLFLDLHNAKQQDYVVRITVSNDYDRQVRHRYITLI
ncbi:hypothetical protein GOV04_00120 [Candidatus Woesearchaeota archaeon]|nr:hypothetical protein [Candidatus Woesearchaeota archaeon]